MISTQISACRRRIFSKVLSNYVRIEQLFFKVRIQHIAGAVDQKHAKTFKVNKDTMKNIPKDGLT